MFVVNDSVADLAPTEEGAKVTGTEHDPVEGATDAEVQVCEPTVKLLAPDPVTVTAEMVRFA